MNLQQSWFLFPCPFIVLNEKKENNRNKTYIFASFRHWNRTQVIGCGDLVGSAWACCYIERMQCVL